MGKIDLALMASAFTDRFSFSIVSFEHKPPKLESIAPSGSPIDIPDVANKLERHPELQADGGTLLPLHELDSAELTGEYVLYQEESRRTVVTYHKELVDRDDKMVVSAAGKTEIGWRLRFWTDEYDPAETPSYMPNSESSSKDSPLEYIPRVTRAEAWTRDERETFFDNLFGFVESEKDRQRSQNMQKYEDMGQHAFRGVEGGMHDFVPVYHDSSAEEWHVSASDDEDDNKDDLYICAETGLWEESEVFVDSPPWADSPSGLPVQGKITDSGTRTLVFEIPAGADEKQKAEKSLNWIFNNSEHVVSIYPIFNSIPFDREIKSINKVRKNEDKVQPIVGGEGLQFAPARALGMDFDDLNRSQTKAASYAVAADDIALIHGPPGTGKTRTLVRIIKELVNRGKRVLACAHSNQATDNLLVGGSTVDEPDKGSLHEAHVNEDLTLTRIGSGSDNQVVQQYHVSDEYRGEDVVGATMSGAADFNKDQFDVAIVDEASQASIPATFAPWYAARSMVLAGDHKQLPPYGSDEMQQRDLEVSLYELLVNRYGEDYAQMLDTQYRMHEKIAEFPSKQFYDGKLETVQRDEEYGLWDLSPVSAYHVTTEEEQAFSTSYRNVGEAKVVADEVAELREMGVPQNHIGVITGYTGQIQAVRTHLEDVSKSTHGIDVDTVDSFQGGEKTVIIMSFVRSNPEGRSGFLSLPDVGPRRLNVALTRAKKRLVLVGNWDTLTAEEHGREDCTDIYVDYRSWLLKNGYFESTA